MPGATAANPLLALGYVIPDEELRRPTIAAAVPTARGDIVLLTR